MVVEKSFDEHVTENLDLPRLFGHMGQEPVFHISGDYYPDLVRDFYANMLYKTDKDLQTIITTVKGVHIILDRVRLMTILGIRDEGESATVDSKRKTIYENRD